MGIRRPPVGQIVVIIKVGKAKVDPPPPPSPIQLQFGARDLGFLFLGSGGGADECGLSDQRSLKMSGDMSDGEDVFEMTKDGRFDDETGEPEVIVHLPRVFFFFFVFIQISHRTQDNKMRNKYIHTLYTLTIIIQRYFKTILRSFIRIFLKIFKKVFIKILGQYKYIIL